MRTGDKVEAVLLEPLEVGGITVADAGSMVTGFVGSVMTRRTSMGARLSSRNWLNSSAAVSLHFSDMSAGGRSYRINAEPAPSTSVRGADPNVPLSIDENGRVIVEFHGGKYMAVTAGVSAIAFAAGPAGLIAGPAISAVLGASIPEYALDRPADEDSSATKARGALTGAVKGLPGGVLVTGLANRGLDVSIAAGEALTLELKDDFVIPAQISAR